jgi:hypothetical protein
MKLRITLKRTGIALFVAALNLSLTSCSKIPTGPTLPMSGDVRVSGLTAGATGSFTGSTTTWSCVTAGRAGILSSANGCEPANAMLREFEGVAALAAPGPTGSLSGSVTGSTVALTWLQPTSADPATSYVVEVGSSAGAANLASFDTGSSATTLTVTAVPSGTYYVRVRAKNSAGTSAPSNEVVLTVGGGAPCSSPPGAPGGLTATVSGSSVTLTWNTLTGTSAPTAYVLEAGSSPGASDLAKMSTGSAAASFAASAVAPGTYYLRVRAANACGVSPASNEVVVIIDTTIPPPVPPSVTGRWIGVAPGGMIADAGSNECPVEWDLEMDLTSSGTTVMGTATTRNRKVQFTSCSDVFGFVATYGVNGTVGSGGAISFTFGTGTSAFTFNGTFSATRMSGRFVGPNSQPGAFTVNRQ